MEVELGITKRGWTTYFHIYIYVYIYLYIYISIYPFFPRTVYIYISYAGDDVLLRGNELGLV